MGTIHERAVKMEEHYFKHENGLCKTLNKICSIMAFLPASARSVPPGIHFGLLWLLLLVLLWRPLVKRGTISADSWSNMIRHDQKLYQTW
jgi:hypothetical protein